jgi:hypothetical protein
MKLWWLCGLNLVDWHAHMNQSFYFQYVSLGCNKLRALFDAILNRCQVMDCSIGFGVFQEAQVFLGLLVLQKVDSVRGREKAYTNGLFMG